MDSETLDTGLLNTEELDSIETNSETLNDQETFEEVEKDSLGLYGYNEKEKYPTESRKTSMPRYEEVQIRFNKILQNRVQLKENLTGSQITYLLDFYVEQAFKSLLWIRDEDTLHELLQEEYNNTIQHLLKTRRKLFSIRFQNTDAYSGVTEILFTKTPHDFIDKFLGLKLNREYYWGFLKKVLEKNQIKDTVMSRCFFYHDRYIDIKNLILGNYIRFAFAETNKFFSYNKGEVELEKKEDYFSGVLVMILKVIDKYDSYKGTLTSFIENWLKDYRTTFKAAQSIVLRGFEVTLAEEALENFADEVTENSEEDNAILTQIVEKLLMKLNVTVEELVKLVYPYRKNLPVLSTILRVE
jgi:hypothetical protein